MGLGVPGGSTWSTNSPQIAVISSASLQPAWWQQGHQTTMPYGVAAPTTQQSALQNWLQGQIGAQNGYYNSQLGGLSSQIGSTNAYANNQANYNQQLANINGTLNNQSLFRDVTLGKQQNQLQYQNAASQYNIGQQSIAQQLALAEEQNRLQSGNFANQQTTAQQSWQQLQDYLSQQMGFGIQGYNQSQEARNDSAAQAGRQFGYTNQDINAWLSGQEQQGGLDQEYIKKQMGFAGSDLKATMADIAAGRQLNDAQLSELRRALGVEQGFVNQDWSEAQRQNAAGGQLNARSFAELQRDLGAQRGTTNEQLAIQTWLNTQQGMSNDAALDLAKRQSGFAENVQQRQTKSKAITAGALSSVGLGRDFGDIRQVRNFTDEGATQQWQSNRDQLSAQQRGYQNQYQEALDQLTGALNRGEIQRDATTEQLLQQLNAANLQMQRGNENIVGQGNQGQLAWQNATNQLNSQSGAANRGYNQAMAGFGHQYDTIGQQLQQARYQATAGHRDAAAALEDNATARRQQQQQDWLNYQQGSAGIHNQLATGQIGYDAARQGINYNAQMADLGLRGTQSALDIQGRQQASQFGLAQGQYGINNQSLNSLGQTYATRSQQLQAALAQQQAQLRYGQSQSIAGLGSQAASLSQQQQQANQQLYLQALGLA